MFRRIAKAALPVVVIAVIAAISIGAAGPCDILGLLMNMLG